MSTWRELTFPTSLKDVVLVIEDERANVLTDPLRWLILEILGAGKSVAEISQTLDVTDARVLYHLQRLAQTGVVHLEEDGADPQEWRCLPAAGTIRVQESRSANDQVAEAIPTDVVGQFNQAFREAAEGLYGSTFQQSINHNRARLSEEQAAEFGRRLLALIEEYFPPGKGDRQGIKYGELYSKVVDEGKKERILKYHHEPERPLRRGRKDTLDETIYSLRSRDDSQR